MIFYTNKIELKVGGYIGLLYINGSSTVSRKTFLGKNIHFNGMEIGGCGDVTIGEGAIIQAGSVVVKDIPKYAIAEGSPAIVFSQRNVEHYEELKKKKRFH